MLILSRMGDMASPGSDTIAETDHIATNAVRGIVPLPVLICMMVDILLFDLREVQLLCRSSLISVSRI